MIQRRKLFNMGLAGSAAALLGTPVLRTASGATLRPVLTPFLDEMPLPPSPTPIAWQPNQIPFADLDPEARPHVDATQLRGKVRFYRIVSEVRRVQFHAQLPATEIWGYADGNLPAGKTWDYALGPTFRETLADHNRYNGAIVRHESRLPSVQDHRGFGEPRLSVHLHGAHLPARFDGFPGPVQLADGRTFDPNYESGSHFDYAYPMVDPNFPSDDEHGDHFERASTLWYHDHALDFTAPNVYRGLAGLFLLCDHATPDAADPHRNVLLEHLRDTCDERNLADAPYALRLPSGPFDIPMVLQEKTFGLGGELVYDVFNTDGFMGEHSLVNGKVQPYLPVKRRKYRFRFLNGSNARIYQLFLCDGNGRSYPMTQIATEGGLLSRPVRRPSFILSMAERVEVVIDFSQFPHPQFSELYIENRLVQDDGRGPDGKIERPELVSRGKRLLKLRLEESVEDPSQVASVLRPFDAIPAAKVAEARTRTRTFVFERTNGQWAINGRFAGDLSRPVATPRLNVGEVWRFVNKSGGWWHPIHVHHEFMRVLRRNGRLPFDGTGTDYGQHVERDGLARKDTITLGPNSEVEVYLRFSNYRGPFVFHCHNIEHEDHAMMARFDVI